MDFFSVDDFLRQATSSKENDRQAIEKRLAPILSDSSVFGVMPEMYYAIDQLVEKHGDEVYKQIGIFVIGQWAKVHEEWLQQHVINEGISEALLTMNDLSRITLCLQTLEAIGSFGGDDSWRGALKNEMGQTVLETLEEKGIDPGQWVKEMQEMQEGQEMQEEQGQ